MEGALPAGHSSCQCSECNFTLVDPVQDGDGRRLCKSCVGRALLKKPRPQAHLSINYQFYVDVAAANTNCYCENNSCDWIGSLKYLKDHLENCRYKPIKCEECGIIAPRDSISHHRACCRKLHLFNDAVYKMSGVQETSTRSNYVDLLMMKLRDLTPLNSISTDITTAIGVVMSSLRQENGHFTFEMIPSIYSENGVHKWKVGDYVSLKNNVYPVFSAPFYTHKNGYKLMLRLDVNGSDAGKNSHLSLYVVMLCGENDSTLLWPLKVRAKFTLYNFASGEDITASCNPVFTQPTLGENMKAGFSQFIGHQFVGNGFVMDNMIFIKCEILLRPIN